MSDPREIRVQTDKVGNKPIAIIIIVFVLVMVASFWVAWVLLVKEKERLEGIRAEARPIPRRAPPSISDVRQTPISENLARRYRSRVATTLSEYEWVDRESGLVRIPIRRAMELRAEGMKP